MPLYEYECRTCKRTRGDGVFCAFATMAHYRSRAECPSCHTYGRRIISLPYAVGLMKVKSYNNLDVVLGEHCETSKDVDRVCEAKGLARCQNWRGKPKTSTVDRQMVAEKYLKDV